MPAPTPLPGRTALRLAIVLMHAASKAEPAPDGTVTLPFDVRAMARILGVHVKTIGKVLASLTVHDAVRIGGDVAPGQRRYRNTVTLLPGSWVWAAARQLSEGEDSALTPDEAIDQAVAALVSSTR